MSGEPTKRQPGRPRKQRPPWREIRIRIAEDVLAQIDGGYSAFFEAAAREKLARVAIEQAVLDDVHEFIVLHAWDTSVGHRIDDYIAERRAALEQYVASHKKRTARGDGAGRACHAGALAAP